MNQLSFEVQSGTFGIVGGRMRPPKSTCSEGAADRHAHYVLQAEFARLNMLIS